MPKLAPSQILPSTKDIRDPAAKKWAREMTIFLDQFIRKTSLADNISQVKNVEISVSTNTGGSDGNWRITGTGTSLSIQNKQSGTWVDEFLLEPSA